MFDIINLPYPMFITSPEEKELLRKVELAVANKPLNKYFAICLELNEFEGRTMASSYTVYRLKLKIGGSLSKTAYLHSYMLSVSPELSKYYYSLDNFDDRYVLQRYMRLVWINKLLNYTGE